MRASPVGYGGAFVGGRGRGLGGQGVSDAGARREALGCAARCSCEISATRAVAAVVPPRPPGHERGETTVFCAPHSPAHFAGRAAREAGLGAGGGREGSPHALRGRSLPPPHPRVCACDRRGLDGGAPWSQRDAHRSATASLRMGGYQRIKKPATGFPEPSPTGGRARSRGTCVSTGARVPRAGASAARRTRPVKKEKKAAARRAPTAGEAHRMHAGNSSSHALQKTCCAQSTRRRACYKVFRLRRRGGRWVGGTGRALERAPRR